MKNVHPVVCNVYMYICMSVSSVHRRGDLSHNIVKFARANSSRQKRKTVKLRDACMCRNELDLLEQPNDKHISLSGLSEYQAK